MKVFDMKIIMRRVSMIFYSENHGYDNAVRRCLSDKNKWFYQIEVGKIDGSRQNKSYGLGRVGFPQRKPAVAEQAVSISFLCSSVAKFDYPIAT